MTLTIAYLGSVTISPMLALVIALVLLLAISRKRR